MAYTLAQAAEATGKSKSTILRAIQGSKLSATRDEASQSWMIEPAELHRLYPPVAAEQAGEAPRTDHASDGVVREVELLREMLADKDTVIADLRRRLDAEGEERRKLVAIITDQRTQPGAPPAQDATPAPRRKWWPFGRQG